MKEKRFMNQQRPKRFIISGGGTGGHIFPAISIANALRRLEPGCEILFIGAEGRMEMEKVPAAGYTIKGLPVSGLNRKNLLKNIPVLFRLMKSLRMARAILKEFNPDVVVGVGGYASGPVLRMAGRLGIPFLIQEQNSYAGVTNKLLASKAGAICVAYEGMQKYFPAGRIIRTGNPVRQNFDNLASLKDEAVNHFGISAGKPVILVLGGSLGARTINNSLSGDLEKMSHSGCQWIWQTGKFYYNDVNKLVVAANHPDIKVVEFINRMDLAFSAADIIISRAGAGTISELCLVGKPVILLPSPNVAEDHQTKNALALTGKNAAIMIKDSEASEKLVDAALSLVNDNDRREKLSAGIIALAERDADLRIAKEVLKLAGNEA